MSYILDALKKSDQERKRGDVPNLQTVHIPINAEPQTPFFLYGFIFLLVIALAFVIGLVVSDQESGVIRAVDSSDHLQDKNAASKVVIVPPILKVEKLAEPVVKKKNAISSNMPILKKSSEEVVQKNVQIKLKSVKAQKNHEKPVRAEIEPSQPVINKPDLNDIPYLHEMPDYRQQSVPEMSFAGHVYSGMPSSRSVIINGASMSEGDVIVQGLNVVEITPSGVVFSLHNELFRMDILQDWSFE